MATISLEVDPDLANAYASAAPQDRRKLQMLLNLRLRELTKLPYRPLAEIMDEMASEARERGLTPEVLEAILRDE